MQIIDNMDRKDAFYISVILLIFAFSIGYTAGSYPNPGHPASEIGSGTFNNMGDIFAKWIFPGDVDINYDLNVDGKVGIGTNIPQSKLDVAGSIRINDDETACTSANSGAMRWNGTSFQGCDGLEWFDLSLL